MKKKTGKETSAATASEPLQGRLARYFGKDLHRLFSQNPMPMWLFDPETAQFLDVNEAAVRAYGYSRDEFLGMTLYDIRPAEDHARLAESLKTWAHHPGGSQFTQTAGWRHRRKDGSIRQVEVYSQNFQAGGKTVRLAIVHDVTSLKEWIDKANEQGLYFRQLFQGSPDAIAIIDRSEQVLDVNPAFQAMFQYAREDAIGRPINELVVPMQREVEAAALSALTQNGRVERRETVRRRKDGSSLYVAASGYPLSIDGELSGAFVIYRDLTRAKMLATELSYQATHDVLTGLLNRAEFERQVQERLSTAPDASRGFGLLHIDLEQFRAISDSHGRAAGEQLLVEIARALQAHARGGDVLGRVGGSEFALLFCDTAQREAENVARRVFRALQKTHFSWEGQSWLINVAAGLMFKLNGETAADLLSGAASACRIAVDKGRDHLEVFEPDSQDFKKQRDEMSWGTRIADSISQDRMTLYLQRIVPTGAPDQRRRFEVLLRMRDDSGEILLPGRLIAAAERYRFMPVVDRYVIDLALRQIKQSQEAGVRLPDSLSINISGMSLGDDNLSDFILDKILQYGVMPGMLCFELTETAAIRNLDRAATFVTDMRNLGCSVALDDFGTGTASFAYLKTFEVDYLKIDGQFVKDLLGSPFDSAIVEVVSKLARIKGLETVAECVENEATLVRLKDFGVNYAQGFFMHRPEPWASAMAETATATA